MEGGACYGARCVFNARISNERWLTTFVASYDEVFPSKYAESSGNPREFVKGLLSTLTV
jgi:hypothetical protein